MDYVSIMTTIASAVTIIYTIKSSADKKLDKIDKRFDKIEDILRNHDQRTSKMEGEVSSVRNMLHALVGSLVGHKTGTEK